MILDKDYTSKVEGSREKFEEPTETTGRVIHSTQVWRDANYIPDTAPKTMGRLQPKALSDNGSYYSGTVLMLDDGAVSIPLIDRLEKVPLKRVFGTLNCYASPLLKNIILENFGSTYVPKIYLVETSGDTTTRKLLAYGLGKPQFDVAAGTIYFLDMDFATKYCDTAQPDRVRFEIDFFKYTGRIGVSVTTPENKTFTDENGCEHVISSTPDLPFRDDIAHFKDTTKDNRRASIKVRGNDNKTTGYILPSEDNRDLNTDDMNESSKKYGNTGKWYNKMDKEDASIANTSGVILLQETLEDTLWEQQVQISGGNWNGGITLR